jgi:hypothetical protein
MDHQDAGSCEGAFQPDGRAAQANNRDAMRCCPQHVGDRIVGQLEGRFVGGEEYEVRPSPEGGFTPGHSHRSGDNTHEIYPISGILLRGDISHLETILVPDNEREWRYWRDDYRICGQSQDIRLIPLYEVRDEDFTVYFSRLSV